MDNDDADMNTALMLDGNAVAGQLQQIFGREMTTAMARCAGCGNDAEMGALMAFTRAPGCAARLARRRLHGSWRRPPRFTWRPVAPLTFVCKLQAIESLAR
ncbi:MAG: hypothetical protein E6J25_04790 [Chloroflexi bacterium]|nr:MAG: hypothetical protein E6J25_04790 [Chloroflexota bacterium]